MTLVLWKSFTLIQHCGEHPAIWCVSCIGWIDRTACGSLSLTLGSAQFAHFNGGSRSVSSCQWLNGLLCKIRSILAAKSALRCFCCCIVKQSKYNRTDKNTHMNRSQPKQIADIIYLSTGQYPDCWESDFCFRLLTLLSIQLPVRIYLWQLSVVGRTFADLKNTAAGHIQDKSPLVIQ